jgi:hypothetical protein
MKLTVNNELHFDVDTEPLQARVMEGIQQMLGDKGGDHQMLRGAVKAACTMGMGALGLKKQDRNDDPIEIVLKHIAGLLFDGLEKQGLHLSGEQLPAPKTESDEDEHID